MAVVCKRPVNAPLIAPVESVVTTDVAVVVIAPPEKCVLTVTVSARPTAMGKTVVMMGVVGVVDSVSVIRYARMVAVTVSLAVPVVVVLMDAVEIAIVQSARCAAITHVSKSCNFYILI